MLARLYSFARVNDPSDALAAANGQFVLVRREAYEATGGHEAVKSEILEDVELARRLKHAGFRIWFGPGDGIVRTRMYRTFSAMWEGWTKNLFLLFGRDRGKVYRAAGELALRCWLPPLGGLALLIFGPPLSWLGAVLLLASAIIHFSYVHRLNSSGRLRSATLLIPGSFIVFLLLLNSKRRYSRNLGVHWKGRHYPAAGKP
jgi:hypothetical protein